LIHAALPGAQQRFNYRVRQQTAHIDRLGDAFDTSCSEALPKGVRGGARRQSWPIWRSMLFATMFNTSRAKQLRTLR